MIDPPLFEVLKMGLLIYSGMKNPLSFSRILRKSFYASINQTSPERINLQAPLSWGAFRAIAVES